MARRIKPIEKITINEQTPMSGRIAYWAENTLVRFIKRVFNDVGDGFKNILSYAFEETIDFIEDGLLRIAGPMLDELLAVDAVPEYIKNTIRNARKGEDAAAAVLLIPLLAALLIGAAMAIVAPFQRRIQYEIEQIAETYRPGPAEIMAMQFRGVLSNATAESFIDEIGVTNELAGAYSDLVRKRLSDDELGSLLLRGEISLEEFRGELGKRGMAPYDIDNYTKLLQLIPPPQDMVRMAVREAWDDSVANKFGYDDHFPTEFGVWAEKLGLSSDWAQRYWRAHWELPGVRDAFDMFHRRIIDEGELELLLRTKDIPSFWRKSLIKLSYNVITRVDVRRMYESGVKTEDEVYETYLDIGYKPEDARSLTDWTVIEYGESSRNLVKGDIINSFTDSVITEGQATTLLADMGYTETDVILLLARASLKKQERFEKEYIQNVRVAYVGKHIDENQVVERLNKLNPPSGFIEERLLIWDLQKERGVKRPTKSDLKTFVQQGVITGDEAKGELEKQNYPPEYIQWYLELWLSD